MNIKHTFVIPSVTYFKENFPLINFPYFQAQKTSTRKKGLELQENPLSKIFFDVISLAETVETLQ
jgi:hypothetical protein